MKDYIELELDLSNVDKTITDMDRLWLEIEQAISDGIDEIIERLHNKMIENLGKYGLGDSQLARDVRVERTEDGIAIGVGSDYAVFVEYGTGIVGATTPHPEPQSGWIYDVNDHGERGWWYPSSESDPNPYKSIDKVTGQIFAWTKGMPSRPFMYDTWKYGRRIVTRTINKHLRRIKI